MQEAKPPEQFRLLPSAFLSGIVPCSSRSARCHEREYVRARSMPIVRCVLLTNTHESRAIFEKGILARMLAAHGLSARVVPIAPARAPPRCQLDFGP